MPMRSSRRRLAYLWREGIKEVWLHSLAFPQVASLDLTPLCLENPPGGDSVTFRSVVKTPAANCTKGNGQEGFLGGKTAILIKK